MALGPGCGSRHARPGVALRRYDRASLLGGGDGTRRALARVGLVGTRVSGILVVAFCAMRSGVAASDARSTGATLPAQVRSITHFGGMSAASRVVGNTGYLASGHGLVVLDLADRTHPREFGQVHLGGAPASSYEEQSIYAIDLIDTIALVAGGADGLLIADVSSPNAPKKIGAAPVPGGARWVASDGTHAFVADRENGVRAFDVSDPSQLTETAFFSARFTYKVVVQGDRLYTLSSRSGGYRVYVLSVPTLVELGHYDPPLGSPVDLAVQGTVAYVSQSDYNGNGWVRAVDLSDPAQPTERGVFHTASNPYAYVAAAGSYVFAAPLSGYLDSTVDLDVIDVSNPTQPAFVASLALPPMWDISSVAIADGFAYLTPHPLAKDFPPQLLIIDARTPTQPGTLQVVGRHDTVVLPTTIAVDESRGTAVVGENVNTLPGVDVVDVSQPTSALRLGYLATGVDSYDWVEDIALDGELAYIAGGDRRRGLVIADVSDREQPVAVSETELDHWPRHIAVEDGRAYILDGVNRLWVYDVSDPARPEAKSHATLDPEGNGYAYGLALWGSYALVALGDDGLRLVDVSIDTNAHEIGRWDAPSYTVAAHGRYGYVKTSAGLQVLDLSDPSQPAARGFFPAPPASDGHIIADGHYVLFWPGFVWGTSYGLYVLDVAEPDAPTELTFYAASRTPDVAYRKGRMYMAQFLEVEVAEFCGVEDLDGDLVGELCDNCAAVANPDQQDANDDGMGDACDLFVDGFESGDTSAWSAEMP